ncbi:pyruvate dehydrogenase complex dihydrolipoyllysine-residue acetyltransferase [Phytohalomonas tamaricis]|uniref:pyruvate dehydrogenase complex dihydrolipoyllysine-residue acetyltransferase n=1 Tax=Phytohalomonas tamaricis TaxID=2081032 RepID=UPI000D0B4F1C|nr:pyruvate dehydrogenase complex dihydrolipoyllysine-residue acetyltransferase [Phytohalomonas tamaricis]
MSSEIIKVPDIGGSTDVEIIEIAVSEGDVIAPEDTLITLESDKASMDVPSPKAGTVKRVLVKEGDKVSEGDDIVELEMEGDDSGDAAQDDTPAQREEPAGEEKLEQPAQEEEKSAAPKSGGGKRTVEIKVPDLSGSDDVPIIELAVSEGDEVDVEDPLITLESDKASMDVPSPHKGKIVSLTVKEGDHVSTGDVIGTMEIADESDAADQDDAQVPSNAEQSSGSADYTEQAAPDEADSGDVESEGESQRKELRVPDLGGSENVPIIEIAVSEGDEVNEEDSLITLESDKASMDVPSPFKGTLVELSVKEGDTVSEGDLIGYIEVTGSKRKPAPAKKDAPKAQGGQQAPAGQKDAGSYGGEPAPKGKQGADRSTQGEPGPEAQHANGKPRNGKLVHAGPAVRMLARELGVELSEVTPSGPKDRILKEDVHAYVKSVMKRQKDAPQAAATATQGGAGIPPIPAVDFSQFGEVEEKPMGRLTKAGALNLHRSWLNVPHVTQFDEADITELENFRKAMKEEVQAQGARLTPLPFLIKAAAYALKKYPQFNVSLHPDGDKVVWKKYVHIGVAVDTPNGLLVPVIRDVDKKSITDIAKETVELAKKAQDGKIRGDDMKGGCFTISSLGSIGGTAFTPIVNAPEVAILGVSKAQMKPVWNGKDFTPRLMMPLSLSYDHRAVNGADAARFTAFLAQVLSDIRRLVL